MGGASYVSLISSQWKKLKLLLSTALLPPPAPPPATAPRFQEPRPPLSAPRPPPAALDSRRNLAMVDWAPLGTTLRRIICCCSISLRGWDLGTVSSRFIGRIWLKAGVLCPPRLFTLSMRACWPTGSWTSTDVPLCLGR